MFPFQEYHQWRFREDVLGFVERDEAINTLFMGITLRLTGSPHDGDRPFLGW